MLYSNDMTVEEARELYFRNSGFDAKTYTDRWVALPVGRFIVYFPNIPARKKAVKLHDINHILTEYKTDWLGEFQISGYELGTGCRSYWAAWLLNFQGAFLGALGAPGSTIRAFARGRRSKGIYDLDSVERVLKEKVGSIRAATTAPDGVNYSIVDLTLFWLMILIAVMIHVAPIALLIALLI